MSSRVLTKVEDPGDPRQTAALLERLNLLRSILPGMATEVAIARREAARLRQENGKLHSRVREFEARRDSAARPERSPAQAGDPEVSRHTYVGFPAAPTQAPATRDAA